MKIIKFFLPFFKLAFGIAPLIIAGALSAGGSALSGIAGANAEEEAYKRRKRAYDNLIKKADDTQQTGEQAFYDVVNNPNQYLGTMQKQLNDNTNKSLNMYRNQLLAGLSQQGLRGGQAMTQLNRGLGNVANQANQDLNTMLYNDANQNRQLKMAYEQAKALAGLNAGLQQFQG